MYSKLHNLVKHMKPLHYIPNIMGDKNPSTKKNWQKWMHPLCSVKCWQILAQLTRVLELSSLPKMAERKCWSTAHDQKLTKKERAGQHFIPFLPGSKAEDNLNLIMITWEMKLDNVGRLLQFWPNLRLLSGFRLCGLRLLSPASWIQSVLCVYPHNCFFVGPA